MSFKANGMPSNFVRTQGNANAKKRTEPRLVKIDSYDIGQRQINCVDAINNERMLVQIRPETVAKNAQRSKEKEMANASNQGMVPKWEGYLIDTRMATHLPPGQTVVLERCERTRQLSQNGSTVGVYWSDRVINVADPSPEKTIVGLFSISTYENHIFHVQKWEEKAVDINDSAQLDRICKTLNEGSQAFLNKEWRTHMGVQFRVVVPGATPADKCTVIDISPPFDWIPRQFNANQEEIAPGRPLDGDKFMELLFNESEGYLSYAKNSFSEETYPGFFVEIVPYVNFRAGPKSRYMDVPERVFDPIYKLANTQTKLSLDDESFTQGKNIAVKGILQLSADQVDLQTRTFRPRNIAVRLHADGPMGHVHAWVRANDGRKTEPHPNLRQVIVQKNIPGERMNSPAHYHQSTPAQNRPQTPQTLPQESPGSMDQRSAFDWDDDDPFGEFGGGNDGDLRAKIAEANRNMG